MGNIKNILIVEDLPSDAELAKREVLKVLPDSKFRIVDEKDNYIRAINTFIPDLIISDYQMPKFDGFSALIIRNNVISEKPFIMLTGSVNEEVAVKCMKNGADDYVIKEHIKRLGPAIINAIEKKKSETERRKIEEQLKLVSTAVEQSPVSIVITDKAGDIVYVNPTFEKSTGYTFKEAIGENPRILKSGDMQPQDYETLWNKLSSGKQWVGEFKNKRKDGSFYWESATISPVRDAAGIITHYLAVKEDISERREMVRELMNREEKYRTLTHNLNVGVYRNGSGKEGRFIEGNPAFLKIFGLKNKKEFDLYKVTDFYPDPSARKLVEDKLKEQGFLLNEEIQLRRKDGELFYASISNTAVKDESDNIIYYDGIIEDITEKKAIQDDIINQKNEMEALNNQLINTEEESKRALAVALHDGLSQSLAVAKFKLSELKDALSPGEENTLLNEILENVQSAINESRNITYELSPPMLYELGLIPTVEWKLKDIEKQNNIKINLTDQTKDYKLDQKKQISLYRTITEAFQNVIKHSKASTLSVSFLIDNEDYIVEIIDDGIGFDYQRVTEKAIQNKKFGLFSIIERIKYLGGKFYIETAQNKGTKVLIKLPVS